MSSLTRALRLALLVALLVMQLSSRVGAATVAETFSQVKPSLAVIIADDRVGTGFCIYSTSRYSYYLTNAHVVEHARMVAIYRHDPDRRTTKAKVIAIGSSENGPDLALIKAAIGNVTPMVFSLAQPFEGLSIATAGYPSAQYKLLSLSGELVPSFHVGVVSAVVGHGRLIEYDAQTLPGNSGGPLIDLSDGRVVGIVQGKLKDTSESNLALGISEVIAPFLDQHGVTYATDQETVGKSRTELGQASPNRVSPTGESGFAGIIGRWEGTDFRSSYDGSFTKGDLIVTFSADHRVYLSSGIISRWLWSGRDYKFKQDDVSFGQSPWWRAELTSDGRALTLYDPSNTTVVMHRISK